MSVVETEELVTFKLNGNDVTVPKGTTVMEAARKEKVSIPHFCWHPGLSVAGVCRFCMVKVKGRPKLEISCNLQATPGMEVDTVSDEVKDSHKWALEFHLANHPLDCPICDQAGECKLQNYYMSVGKYKSQMTEEKVLKPKALEVGKELVLDTERCILCSRCVRFENEVTKTGKLGIFDRGDRAIIGTYGDEKIDHNYQENLVDVCPVGAFTSKKFRFKQRVWFLKEKDSICPGCSTGCAISIHAKPEMETYFRVKPRLDNEVNGHWMCDDGRAILKDLDKKERLSSSYLLDGDEYATCEPQDMKSHLKNLISRYKGKKISLLLTPQYTNEEYQKILEFTRDELGVHKVFQWRSSSEDVDSFDGILLRGDKNPNTRGMLETLSDFKVKKELKNEFDDCLKSDSDLILAFSPLVSSAFNDLSSDFKKLSELKSCVCLFTPLYSAVEAPGMNCLVPMTSFSEKKGHYLNYKGQKRELNSSYPSFSHDAFDLCDLFNELAKA